MDEEAPPVWFQVYQAQATARHNELIVRLNDLENRLAVTYNRTSLRSHEPIQPLLRVNGIVPPNFPVTREDLFQLPPKQCVLLLHAYSLSVEGTILIQRNRLAVHIGLIL